MARLVLFRDITSEHRTRFTRVYLWLICSLTMVTFGLAITDEISLRKLYPDKISSYCPPGKQVSVATVARAVNLIDDSEINNSYYPYHTLHQNLRRDSGFEARYHNLELPLSHMAHDLGIPGGSVHALGVIMADHWVDSFRSVYVEIKLPRYYVEPTSWYLFSSSYRGDVCQ